MAFPLSPTDGQTYTTALGTNYTYVDADSAWKITGGVTEYGNVSGSGTINYVPVWSDASTLTDSVLYQDTTAIGLGTTSPSAHMHIKGIGQSTNAFNDASETGGALFLHDYEQSVGSGGALLIGGASGDKWFAGIKGYLTNGDVNSIGNLAISLRENTTDTTLTERLVIQPNGHIGIGTGTPGGMLHLSSSSITPVLRITDTDGLIGGQIYLENAEENIGTNHNLGVLDYYATVDSASTWMARISSNSVTANTQESIIQLSTANGSDPEARMTINKVGSVSIGTTDASGILNIASTESEATTHLIATNVGDTSAVAGTFTRANLPVHTRKDTGTLTDDGILNIVNSGGEPYTATGYVWASTGLSDTVQSMNFSVDFAGISVFNGIGSVSTTDLDGNLCLYNEDIGGGQYELCIKNRLGATVRIGYVVDYFINEVV